MSQHNQPTVAVITPTGLHPARLPFLEELYESIRAQEEGSWEWIIAPNGPRVDPDVVPSAITRDPRVSVITRPGPGPAPARNTALNHVRAPRVAFVDDDDRIPPLSLAMRNEHAIATGLRWVAGRSADWYPESGSLSTWVCPTPVGQHAAGDVWTYWPSPEASKPPLGHCMLLTDTRLAQAVGHGGLHKGEDYSFLMGVCARSAGELLPDVVYHRRVHAGRWTAEDAYRDQAEFDARTHAWLKGRAERELLAESTF
ncbi:glycosyltransferase family 2 protein [Streptomyces halobius]|uniref:Glycosyltransferase n=1 Tax=Streptomyces halobius TaxID=2879846 RepID=A0ABY4M446_9ACTN|nr:glycosyltransferase family A protein [Streptomyces halobius]UQA91135.1 glycosyltransferase [Streptomyces halobius]